MMILSVKSHYDHSQCDGLIPRRHHRRDPEGEVWFDNQALTGLHCLVGSWVLDAHEHYDGEMLVITMVVTIIANFGNLFPWPCTGLK